MRITWAILTLVFTCCTNHQESSEIKSRSDHESTRMNENEAKSSTGYDSLVNSECNYSNLSKEFSVRTTFKRYTNKATKQDSCIIKLYLTNRVTSNLVDSIQLTSLFLFSDAFQNCENVRSYATKHNTASKVEDNYYGDIVIADLNFDNRDDIAVSNDSGGNGGTLYSYFIQTDNKTFVLDKFLTDSVTYFPSKINSNTRTLETYVHAGACGLGENVFQHDKKTNEWKGKSHKVIDLCK